MKKYVKVKMFAELLCQLKIIYIYILKFNQYVKSDKTSCIIYPDFESLI